MYKNLRQKHLPRRAGLKAKLRKGSFLIEASIALFLLVAIALVLLNGSLNILKPRAWTMRQNLADAYLSREVALMNRVDFDSIVNGTSGWGSGTSLDGSAGAVQVQESGSTAITIGRLPNGGAGTPYTAQLFRVRTPLQTNAAGTFTPTGSGAFNLSDLGVRAYKLESHLVYSVDGGQSTHVKSRTVIRSQ